MDLGIRNKRALVCGASQGMGLAISKGLAKEGVDLLMCARGADRLAQSAKETQAVSTGDVHHLACDLSTTDGRDALIKQVKKQFGTVDILIHNTGGPSPSLAEETLEDSWQAGFESLFQSVVHLNLVFVPGMKAQNWGRIINVTSLSVLEPIPNLAVSNAIRSAATAMMKTLSDELAPFNITVNCVAPGSIATGRVEELIEARAKKQNIPQEQYLKDYIKAIPAGRMGSTEEFASVVTFLASEPASYVTGSTICVDGGRRRSTY